MSNQEKYIIRVNMSSQSQIMNILSILLAYKHKKESRDIEYNTFFYMNGDGLTSKDDLSLLTYVNNKEKLLHMIGKDILFDMRFPSIKDDYLDDTYQIMNDNINISNIINFKSYFGQLIGQYTTCMALKKYQPENASKEEFNLYLSQLDVAIRKCLIIMDLINTKKIPSWTGDNEISSLDQIMYNPLHISKTFTKTMDEYKSYIKEDNCKMITDYRLFNMMYTSLYYMIGGALVNNKIRLEGYNKETDEALIHELTASKSDDEIMSDIIQQSALSTSAAYNYLVSEREKHNGATTGIIPSQNLFQHEYLEYSLLFLFYRMTNFYKVTTYGLDDLIYDNSNNSFALNDNVFLACYNRGYAIGKLIKSDNELNDSFSIFGYFVDSLITENNYSITDIFSNEYLVDNTVKDIQIKNIPSPLVMGCDLLQIMDIDRIVIKNEKSIAKPPRSFLEILMGEIFNTSSPFYDKEYLDPRSILSEELNNMLNKRINVAPMISSEIYKLVVRAAIVRHIRDNKGMDLSNIIDGSVDSDDFQRDLCNTLIILESNIINIYETWFNKNIIIKLSEDKYNMPLVEKNNFRKIVRFESDLILTQYLSYTMQYINIKEVKSHFERLTHYIFIALLEYCDKGDGAYARNPYDMSYTINDIIQTNSIDAYEDMSKLKLPLLIEFLYNVKRDENYTISNIFGDILSSVDINSKLVLNKYKDESKLYDGIDDDYKNLLLNMKDIITSSKSKNILLIMYKIMIYFRTFFQTTIKKEEGTNLFTIEEDQTEEKVLENTSLQINKQVEKLITNNNSTSTNIWG